MKLQFDTIEKTIKVEEHVNLGELMEKLEMLLPNNQWKEYTLKVSIITIWQNPIIIENPIPFVDPYRPFWEQPTITCLSHHVYEQNKYNIEM